MGIYVAIDSKFPKYHILFFTTMSAGDLAPESTLPYPPIHKDKKFVVLSDWLVCIVMIFDLP